MAEQRGFVCYRHTLQTLIMLPDESAGRVIKAATAAFLTGEAPDNELALHEQIVLSLFLEDINGAREQYQRICERNRKNGGQSPPVVASGGQSPPDSPKRKETEKKRNRKETEKKRNEGRAAKPPRARFIPPSVEEVAVYCQERHSNIDPQRFVDYYTANGWTQGRGKPIKDWKAAVRTWERIPLSDPPPPQEPDWRKSVPNRPAGAPRSAEGEPEQ